MTIFHAQFHVDGIPKGQPRPRAFAFRGHARIYDAGTAEGWKSLVAAAAAPHKPNHPITGACGVWLTFFLPRPKSRCRKSDSKDRIVCTSKPDADNLAKAVLDCLTQQGWWNDDAQVTHLNVQKWWPAIGDVPGCRIKVYEFSEAIK